MTLQDDTEELRAAIAAVIPHVDACKASYGPMWNCSEGCAKAVVPKIMDAVLKWQQSLVYDVYNYQVLKEKLRQIDGIVNNRPIEGG